MSTQAATALLDDPSALMIHRSPRIRRREADMTCPDCGLEQSVALDCVGCGRIMKPAVDFRLAEPISALESLEPVEVEGPTDPPAGPRHLRAEPVVTVPETELGEPMPWVRMLLSLGLCLLAWRYNLALDPSSAAASAPFWVEPMASIFGHEGGVAAALTGAVALMIGAARRVLA